MYLIVLLLEEKTQDCSTKEISIISIFLQIVTAAGPLLPQKQYEGLEGEFKLSFVEY